MHCGVPRYLGFLLCSLLLRSGSFKSIDGPSVLEEIAADRSSILKSYLCAQLLFINSCGLDLEVDDCSSWSCHRRCRWWAYHLLLQLLFVRLCLVSWCNIVIEFLWNDVDVLLICCTDPSIVIGVPMAAQWLPHWVPWRCLGHFLRIGAACDTWSSTGSVNIGAAQSTACLIFEVDGSPVLEEVAADRSSILELPSSMSLVGSFLRSTSLH